MTSPLRFVVAPHIVEDLGLNLYTSLPRVLVEYIANAYDADATYVDIEIDIERIRLERRSLREQFKADVAEAKKGEIVEPLATRVLPVDCSIKISDDGHGMNRDDLRDKFLVAGRRRRREEPDADGRSPGSRPLMGRKGLGKLAGFGVAKTITVTTRTSEQDLATRVTLDFDALTQHRVASDATIPESLVELPRSGTTIELTNLLFDPVKSRETTIQDQVSEHFDLIDPEEFEIRLNGKRMAISPRPLAYAWPDPEASPSEFVEHTLPREDRGEIRFRYRLRFMAENHALPASRRGVRVYSHHRLASAPSLLDADTNMHGFRMTDYLDGVVHADFLDEEQLDYIATDRQGLRWDAPLLTPLYKFLSSEIKKACAKYQGYRDNRGKIEVEKDQFTTEEIERHEFSRKDRALALKTAALLRGACKQGVSDPDYKARLPELLRGIGHGDIMSQIMGLSKEADPSLDSLLLEVTRLAASEWGQFVSSVRARVYAIKALQKIVGAVDFKAKENEGQIQKLFEKSPWLIDPRYSKIMSADQKKSSLFQRLEKELGISKTPMVVGTEVDERPDLVFLLGNESLRQVIVVELKSANTPLESKHLDQLMAYMGDAEEWLDAVGQSMKVEGQLIGSLNTGSKAKGVRALMRRIDRAGMESDWRVRDYVEVLNDTLDVHQDILTIADKEGV